VKCDQKLASSPFSMKYNRFVKCIGQKWFLKCLK
jgi:hypothetical protein